MSRIRALTLLAFALFAILAAAPAVAADGAESGSAPGSRHLAAA
jgi:hypothetical protein